MLRFDVDGGGVVLRVGDDRQVQALRVRARKTSVAVRAPLHRRADAVAVAEVDVVTHPDLVAVIDDRGAGQREQQAVHQLDLATAVAEQGRETAPDAEVDACALVLRVDAPHVVALFVGHHLERQLVVVAQEDRPLRALGDVRRLVEDVDDREAVLHARGHVQAWHEREVEGHVTLVAVTEVVDHFVRPHVRLGKQHLVATVARVDVRAQVLERLVRLRQVLAVGAVLLEQVRDGVEAQAVDAHVEPEVDDVVQLLHDRRVLPVQVGLVRVEAVPVVLPGDRVPGPVRRLEILEDDAHVRVAIGRVAPHVEVAIGMTDRRAARALEPLVLVGRVVEDELGDDAQASRLGLGHERAELLDVAVGRVHAPIVGGVVAVVLEWRRIERQQPDGRDAELLQIVEAAGQATKVADAVTVGIGEGLDVQLVDDRVLVPARRVRRIRHVRRILSRRAGPGQVTVNAVY